MAEGRQPALKHSDECLAKVWALIGEGKQLVANHLFHRINELTLSKTILWVASSSQDTSSPIAEHFSEFVRVESPSASGWDSNSPLPNPDQCGYSMAKISA